MPVIQSLEVAGVPATKGGTVTVTVSAQSPEGLALTYAWSVSAEWTIAEGGSTSSVTITAPGSYGAGGTATVNVTDAKSRVATGTVGLSTVGNNSPIIHTIAISPNPVTKGSTATVSATASDPNGDPLSYSWTVPSGYALQSGQGTPQISVVANRFVSGNIELALGDGNGGSIQGSVFVSTHDGQWGAPALLATEYELSAVGPAIAMDSAGNALAVWTSAGSVYARRYTAGSWGAPDTIKMIETGSGVAFQSEMAMVPATGNAVVIWHQLDGQAHRVYANRYSAGTNSWGTAVPIGVATGIVYEIRVVVDSAGNAIAVWDQDDEAARNVYANRLVAGGSWGTATILNAGTGKAYSARVAVRPSTGNAIAVWEQQDGAVNSIFGSHFNAATNSWGATFAIDESTADAHRPGVAVDGAGNGMAVWSQHDGTYFSIYAKRYDAGSGAWGVVTLIEALEKDVTAADVVLNSGGKGFAVFQGFGGLIYASRWTGAAWVAEAELGAASFNPNSPPPIAINDAGDALAVWRSDGIYAIRYTDAAGTWGGLTKLSAGTGLVSGPRVAFRAGGTAAVALWQQMDGTRWFVNAATYNGAAWAAAEKIGNPGASPYYPAIATDPAGNAFAVWTQFDGNAFYNACFSRYDAAAGSWGSVSAISASSTTVGAPKVGTDAVGNAIAVWSQRDAVFSSVYASRYSAATGLWSSPTTIESAGVDAYAPEVAVDASGNAVAVWYQREGATFVSYASRYNVGSGLWDGTPHMLGALSRPYLTTSPRVRSDAAGNATVLWGQSDGSNMSLYSKNFVAASGTWGPAVLLGTGPEYVSGANVAVNAAGSAAAVWTQGSYAYVSLYDAATNTWGGATSIDPGFAYGPAVGLDDAGNAVVVWNRSGYGYPGGRLLAKRYLASTGSWSGEVAIKHGKGGAYNSVIAMDPVGNALVVWIENDAIDPDLYSIYANRYRAGAGWSGAVALETRDARAYHPTVAVDSTGNGIAAWEQYPDVGYDTHLWFSMFR